MDCQRCQRWLAENLPASFVGHTAPVASHLAACKACQTALSNLRRTMAALEAMPEPASPPQLRGRVLAGVAGRRRKPAWLTPVLAAAGVAALVLLNGLPTRRPPGPLPGDLHPDGMVAQHAVAMTADPLADATALQALAALAERRELETH
jgi:anti-sigma factor RsiW